MEAFDIIEKRIDGLSRMLGAASETNASTQSCEIGKSFGTENVVDSLTSAHTILEGALKERQQIQTVLNRANELEKYLDSEYITDTQQAHSKEVYLNAVAPDLHNQFSQLEQIKGLESTLGAEYFRNIPDECIDKLKKIQNENEEYAQQTDLIEQKLFLAMKQYGEIQEGLINALENMNKRLDAIEDKIEHKKRDKLQEDCNLEESKIQDN